MKIKDGIKFGLGFFIAKSIYDVGYEVLDRIRKTKFYTELKEKCCESKTENKDKVKLGFHYEE